MELKLQVTPKAKPSFQLPWSQLACGVLEEVNVSQRIPSPPACLAISFPTHFYARGGTTYLRICRLLCWHSTHQSTQIDQLPYTTEMAAMEMMMTKLQNVSWLNRTHLQSTSLEASHLRTRGWCIGGCLCQKAELWPSWHTRVPTSGQTWFSVGARFHTRLA